MSKNDGGPAFPVSDQGTHGVYGMSLRDWFAGQALAGWLASYGPDSPHPSSHGNGSVEEDTAKLSYQIADAMLKAREK